MVDSIYALVVLLACSFAWVGLDLLRKLLAGRGRATAVPFLLVAAQIPLFVAWAVVDGRWTLEAPYWLPGLASVLVNLLANLAYMQSVRLAPMSATLPLLSLTPGFTALLAVPLLAEWPTAFQTAGIVLVVLGAVLLSVDWRPGAGEAWRALRQRGALLMILVAVLWSLATPLDKLALRHASPALHALVLVVGIAGGLFAALLWQRRLEELKELRATAGLLVAAAIVSGVALYLQLLAIQLIWVSLVETVKRGLGATMALLLGRLIFAEEVSWRQVAAVGLMLLGVWWVLL